MFNTVYYVRNFWDGRAGRTFDGFTVTAANEAEAPDVLIARNGGLERQQARLDKASLAAQAVGPALDHLEMSYAGRTWPMLAKKLLRLPPLALQKVAIDDSGLGPLSRKEARGLEERHSYLAMIHSAFEPKFWESSERLNAAGDLDPMGEFTRVAYQSTLNSDASPFDCR